MKQTTVATILFIPCLTLLWIYLNRGQDNLLFYVVDLPVFVILYGLMFSIGLPDISQGLRYGTKSSLLSTLALPLVLIVIYYLYLWVHAQEIGRGASLLLPYLIVFPALTLYHRKLHYKVFSWSDLVIVLLFLWPVTLVDLSGNSNLPIDGVHFDSVYRMVIILAAVYAFVVVRRLPNVGFQVDASGRKLWTTIWVWAVYIGLVWLVGTTMGLVEFRGWNDMEPLQTEAVIARFLTIFLHTALFEELFFRGLLQNILAGKIRQSAQPLTFWIIGFMVMIILALLVGVGMGGALFWLPVAISAFVFLGAYLLSNFFTGYRHHYLALAIISIFFGLVHFHAGSVAYVGLAIFAGWAYGYVYWKTRNVLYAALIHTLVNISPLLLGIEIIN